MAQARPCSRQVSIPSSPNIEPYLAMAFKGMTKWNFNDDYETRISGPKPRIHNDGRDFRGRDLTCSSEGDHHREFMRTKHQDLVAAGAGYNEYRAAMNEAGLPARPGGH